MSNDEGNYVLLESFQIDDGEIDGLTPQECFVLGYELARISMLAEYNKSDFTEMIHAENRSRVEFAIARRCRSSIITWMQNDISEGWLKLSVYGLQDSGG